MHVQHGCICFYSRLVRLEGGVTGPEIARRLGFYSRLVRLEEASAILDLLSKERVSIPDWFD